jgi:hypothetical protein
LKNDKIAAHEKYLWHSNVTSRDAFLLIIAHINMHSNEFRNILQMLKKEGTDMFY